LALGVDLRMASNFELLQSHERLSVGRRFLALRPRIAAFGVLGNATCLALSGAPAAQRLALACALGGTVGAFFVEAWLLRSRALSERWLSWSLLLTLFALISGVALSGGLRSPLLPLLFAPVVVGFAAFARGRQSARLLGVALAGLVLNALLAPVPGFPAPIAPWDARMLLVSALTSLAMLAVGVIGLVDAHTRTAAQLERMRGDLLQEAERRAASVEQLGARVAHEIKNPLAAARGLVQLVQRRVAEARDRERLEVVVGEIDRALDILKGYLGFARPLADLALTEVDLRTLLDDVAGVLEARAQERSVQIAVLGESLYLCVDRQLLRDALLNLALNSVEAMPRGGRLELNVSAAPAAVCLRVSDEGLGMSAEQLARLGQPFASQAEGGTGLGVLLAQSAARRHGGELRFESAPGRGTCAMLQLPTARG
jgi:signal transduction histidine kinase